MANFERNLDLNDFRNYSYLFLFYKSLTNFLPFTPCALTPHRLLSEKGRLSYAILLHSFLSIFYMCLHVLSCPQNCYNLWRSYFNRNTTLIGTWTALSPFDFNSASWILVIRLLQCNSCYFHVRYNNNALAELNDCIGGLLNLGLIAYYI